MRLIFFIILIFTLATALYGQADYVRFHLDNDVSIDNRLERSLKVQVGDTTGDSFCPNMTITAWDGECQFKVDLRTDREVAAMVPSLTKDRCSIPLKAGERSHIYRREDGNVEWEIVFDHRPDRNRFEFPFSAKGLNFVFQDTAGFDSALKAGSIYPDSAVYSWIAYHKSRRDNWIRIGRDNDTTIQNYGNGIAFTIYRPKIIDSKGWMIWCNLDIDTVDNLLIIEIPSKFLDEAVYPITLDPTIGNTTQEGFYGTINNWVHTALHKFPNTADFDGVLSNAYLYSYNSNSSYVCTVQVALYTFDLDLTVCDSVAVSSKIPVENYGSGSVQWNSAGFPGGESIDSGQAYVVSFIPYSSGGNCLQIAYGFSSWGYIKYNTGTDWTFPSDLTGYSSTNGKWAVYAEYVVQTSGGPSPRRRRQIIGGGK